MTLEDSIHSQRLRVLVDAEQLGNVSEACRRHGMSRTVFYRLRKRLEQYGPDGVHPARMPVVGVDLVRAQFVVGGRTPALGARGVVTTRPCP